MNWALFTVGIITTLIVLFALFRIWANNDPENPF